MKLLALLLVIWTCYLCCSALNYHLKYVNYTIAEKDATQKTKTCSLTIHVNSTLDSVPNSFFGFSRDDKPQSYEKLKYPFKSRHCVTMAQRPTFLFQCRIEAAIGGCLGGNYLARVVQENETITKVLAAPHFETAGEGIPLPRDCSEAIIHSIIARKNDSDSVYVEWKYSKKLDSRRRYCSKARLFEVRYVSYADSSASINATTSNWFPTRRRRVTNLTFSDLDLKRFFKFEVRSANDRVVGKFRKVSPLHYFQPQSPARIDTQDFTRYAKLDEAIDIECKAKGIPTPEIIYYRQGDPSRIRESLSFRAVKEEDAGTYHCRARNNYFNMETHQMQEISVVTTINLVVSSEVSQCVTYSSDVCSEYIRNEYTVFLRDPSVMNPTESLLAQFDDSVNVSNGCFLFAKSYLCHSHLPYCDPTAKIINRPLEVCPQVCERFYEKCASEFEPGTALYKKLFSRCRNSSQSPGDAPGCIYIDSDYPLKDGAPRDIPEKNRTINCIIGNGQTYRGEQRVTESGHRCQRWDTDYPQDHHLNYDMRAELENANLDCRNPGGMESRPWCFVSNKTAGKRWEYCDIPPCITCVPYTGVFCKPLGYTNETLVYLERHRYASHTTLETTILGGLRVHVKDDEITPGCSNALRQLLCYGLMPTCNDTTPKMLCQEHCSLLKDLQFCSTAILKRLNVVTAYLTEKCLSISTDRTQGECMSAVERVKVAEDLEKPTMCYNSNDLGQSYQGTQNRAENGRLCIPWASFRDALPPTIFPSSNYCRNPGQLGKRPWCFTTAGGDWNYCNITVCGDEATSLLNTSLTQPLPAWAIVVITLVILSVAGVILVVVILYVVDKRRNLMPETVEIPMQDNNLYSQELSVTLKQEVKSFRAIDRSSIQYMKQLGGGNFGVVFLGKCKGLENDEGSTLVAVKTLKEESSNVAIRDFINEAKLLHRFRHEHIVYFHGVCMEELPYYLVFEYMDQGDLCEFLRMHSSSAQRRYNPPSAFRDRTASTVSTDSASLGVTQLLDICKQVASGMAYLESEKHIHRDLACRNCLIKTGMTVKVADFGMAQKLYASDYVRIHGQVALPIRWMAPESIIYGTFSLQSDIWSFGVVVWEVFSFALQPYWGLTNGDVSDMIRRGKLLCKPEGCPENIFSIVKDSCWHREPSQRLTFANLVEVLDRLRLSDSDSSDFSTDIIDDNSAAVFDDDDSN